MHSVNGNGNTQTQRMGLNPFMMFYIDTMLNIDANALDVYTLDVYICVCINVTIKV